MKENFLRMLNSVKKEDLVYLLKIYNVYPEDKFNNDARIFQKNITEPIKNFFKGVQHYDPKITKKELHDMLVGRILRSYKIQKRKDMDTAAHEIATKIAGLNKVPIDHSMKTRDIENQLLLNETEEMFPIYLLALRAMLLMKLAEPTGIKVVQEKVIKSFVDGLITTKEQKVLLEKEIDMKVKFKDIRDIVFNLKKKKNIDLQKINASILGFAWIIAISNDVITRKEINFYKELYNELGVKEKTAIKIKQKVEDNFEKIREEIRSELKIKKNKLSTGDISTISSGIAGSLTILGLAEAAGFGLFLFATTTLNAIGLLFGVTFSFATYTTLTSILGVITGPIGWIGIPIFLAGGVLLKKLFDNKGYEDTQKIIIKLAYMRGDI